jgi:uncharacterized protein involved in tolerance to divalent cations
MSDLDPIIINIPCPTKEEAEKICKQLLEKDLCGTAKISSTYLMYPGEKGASGEDVFLMSLKTTKIKLADIHAFILKNHSWGTPCIEVTPMLTDMC